MGWLAGLIFFVLVIYLVHLAIHYEQVDRDPD